MDAKQDTKHEFTDWNDVPLVLTTDEVAALLRITINTVKRMFADGEIKAVKLSAGWRINKTELMKLMEVNEQDYQTEPSFAGENRTETVTISIPRSEFDEITRDLSTAADLLASSGHDNLARDLLNHMSKLAGADNNELVGDEEMS